MIMRPRFTSTFGAPALLIGSLFLLAACANSEPAPTAHATPSPAPDYGAELVRAVGRDGIEAVLDPEIVDAAAVHDSFGPDEPVLVASVNGVERAYALLNLTESEVVNDTLDGIPIAVTW
jgi:hypothetical protein